MLSKGMTIKTIYGEWVKVLAVWDNIVTTYQGTYHITKLLLTTAR